MDMDKIAKLMDSATESLDEMASGSPATDEVTALQWRVMSSCASARAMADAARVRAPGQMLARRLIIEECERLVAMCRQYVEGE